MQGLFTACWLGWPTFRIPAHAAAAGRSITPLFLPLNSALCASLPLHTQLLLAAALPLFFCLLGDTAELYFSPTMALVSQTIPKMRPRFAGGRCRDTGSQGRVVRQCMPGCVGCFNGIASIRLGRGLQSGDPEIPKTLWSGEARSDFNTPAHASLLRPLFPAVTFVAIGNGAPDLSSNISAIRNGQVSPGAAARAV